DVWFSFTPQTDGDYEFTSNADFADVLAVYKGNCSDLLELNSDFNGYKIDIKNAEAEQTYFIQVTGYFAILEGDLCPTVKTKVVNEVPETNCISAIPLTLNRECSVSSNFGAGYSGIRPECDVYIQDDVWFSFVASASRQVYIKVKTDFENIVSLYEGSCNKLKSIYCGKNVHHCNGYLHVGNLEAGKTYYIQLGSKVQQSRHNSGSVCIDLLDSEPVWQKMELQVEQVCMSKGAVKFIPTATGGSGVYTYNGLGLEEAVAGSDSYIIEAKDNEGCVNAMLVNAVSCNDFGCTLTSQLDKINPGCYGASDGRASVSVSGGLEPYNIKWSDGSTGPVITNLTAGSYTVTISDGSGCEQTENFILNQPAQIIANPGYVSPKCYNDSTGVITLFTIGGQGDYSYVWSEGNTDNMLENIPGGDYSVTITDGKGCISSQNFTLNQPDKISISGASVDNFCFGNSQGNIRVEIKGGVSPYSVLWSHGDTLANVDSLIAGIYAISITDGNNCKSTKSWEI
ncbi:MAG: SprB repeat-containing protein, partial [Saprospiraceae bacterium]